MKRNITYIISDIDKALAFEWVASRLSKEKYNLSFVLLNPGPSDLERYLIENNIPVLTIPFFGKKNVPGSIYPLYKFLRRQKTQIVHCHLFEASLVGLTAAKLAGVKKRIHTRHHSSYHHVYFPRAVKYDRYINRLSTKIVAISKAVETILIEKEQADQKKIVTIHHGFDLPAFLSPDMASVEALKKKYNLQGQGPVIGVIARFIEWKGVQFIIPAFKKLLVDFPKARLMLLNAEGNYSAELTDQLVTLPKESYTVVAFEKEIFSVYHLFDVFVHVPIDPHSEAFGQVYIESMAAGVPGIFTLSGVALEIAGHNKNALVVNYKDSDGIYAAAKRLLTDKELCNTLKINALKTAKVNFSIDKMIFKLEELYDRI